MSKVMVLPDHIASQIAAGEVVERPASVVKELVENSLDAGATRIEISIAGECRDIRIADDGCGMTGDDAALAFHRHATSKLKSADDLWALSTMGFRGEALPSIASVAKVTCLTRTADSAVGTKIEARDGKVSSSETGCAPGTVIEVTDLFYNVPARLKFLKKPSTEFSHIHDAVQALAISFPKVVFQLLRNGEVVLKTSGSGKLARAMKESRFITGREELIQTTFTDPQNGLAIYGYVASPLTFKASRKSILSILNNRPVKCPLTYKALEYAFSDLIPRGRHPVAVITITVDPGQVDVNVHPTKKEIKYSNGNDIYSAIQRAVSHGLHRPRKETADQPPAHDEQVKQPAMAGYGRQTKEISKRPALPAHSITVSPAPVQADFKEQLSYTPDTAPAVSEDHETVTPIRARATTHLPSGWRFIGYLHNTYFLLETEEGLEIIEQHIAHERTLYERILAGQDTKGRLANESQRLVISVPLELSEEQKTAVTDNLEKFRSIGFDFEIQGESNLLCTQVPLELAHKDYAAVVQKMIEDVCLTDAVDIELEATKSVACQAAVKNGMLLSNNDIVQLISDWYETPRRDTCPHGRPVKLRLSIDRLFQMFHPD